MSKLAAVATAVPEIQIDADQTRELIRRIVPPPGDTPKYLRMVDSSGINRRHLSVPFETLLATPDPVARNDIYLAHALPLVEQVARRALAQAQVRADELQAIICVSCTGYSIPSVDALLMKRLGINHSARRIPISQLGCSAGAAALGIGASLLPDATAGAVLLISVELGSALLQSIAPTEEDIVGAILFADGAAACVLTGAGDGPSIVASRSVFIDDSTETLGLYMSPTGFRLHLSRHLPNIVGVAIRAATQEFLAANGLQLGDVDFYAVHPGGRRVIESVAAALELPITALQASSNVMQRYGNMSSATIFFVLQELQRIAAPPNGSIVLVVAPGAGMSLELVLLRWDSVFPVPSL